MIAAVLSMAVLFGWSYFFAPPKKEADNANSAQIANTAANAQTPEVQATQPVQTQTVESAPDSIPNKEITIKTPLYEATLDSKGALATSWILLKNKSPENEKPLFADGSTANNQKPLQLISPEALNRDPRELPFRLSTGDQNLDKFLNQRNYQISVNEETVELSSGQEQRIDFVLNDEANAVEITKSFTFRADSYISDLQIKLTKNGQTVPNTKLLIGASIGDHGINHHNFYQIESEGVAAIDGDIKRKQGYYSFEFDANNQASLAQNGNIDWAGVGDSYFAMTAIPNTPTQGLEFRASKYEVQTEPFFDGIFSWVLRNETTKETRHLVTALVPVNTDGSTTKIYTGSKDYFVLKDLNRNADCFDRTDR